MKGLTADQAFMQIQFQRNLVQDASEKTKLDNLILGAVESIEKRKARILAQLDSKERFKIAPKRRQKNESHCGNSTTRVKSK